MSPQAWVMSPQGISKIQKLVPGLNPNWLMIETLKAKITNS